MILRVQHLLLAAVATATLLSAACTGDDEGPIAPVFEAPPWTGPESLSYQLSTRGEDDAGTCVLETLPPATPGAPLTVSRLCGKDEFRDDSIATADPQTLRPIEAVRTRSDAKQGKKAVYTNTYASGTVQFQADIDGRVSTTTRDLPEPTEESPEPAWYDDDTLLWLVRGIPLRDGYNGAYVHVINGGQPRLLRTTVRVDGEERVNVPAGQFTAWKVRVNRENTTWTLWVDQQAPNRLVRATIEDVVYELTSVK